MNFSIPSNKELGNSLYKIAKVTALIIAFAYVITEHLIKLTYSAGYELGKSVHELNDKLANISILISERNWSELISRFYNPINSNPTEVSTTKSTPITPHPLTQIAEELHQLTVKELRELIGVKGKAKLRKAQLIEMAIALV